MCVQMMTKKVLAVCTRMRVLVVTAFFTELPLDMRSIGTGPSGSRPLQPGSTNGSCRRFCFCG